MFEGFAGVWTPLLPVRQIGRRPLLVVLAGESLVAFRGAGGEIGVLPDRCPHRGAALSLGQVTPEGWIECPFHGWQFDCTGRNCHVPFNPDAKLAQLSARALPVRVIGELVWVFTAPGGQSPTEPIVPDGLSDRGLSRIYVQRTWRCHWTRAMENMLDSPHLPFVHRQTIGRSLSKRMQRSSRMEIDWEQMPWGSRTVARVDGEDNGAILDFYKPNVMALRIPVPGKHLRIHAMVIPERPGRTRVIICQSRDFARLSVLDPLFTLMNGRIVNEDKSVVESGGTDEVPPAASEKSVATDRATLQFRKYYYDELRGTTVRSL
ncbi:MAG: aromatic ring-hydroxylating dioxygenase subunit alpha [Reyranellaceae bacterium]